MHNVAIIHTGAVGDLVQALPALAAVREAYAAAAVTFVGRPERGDLARAAGVADARVDLETSGLWRLTAAGGGAAPCPPWLGEADVVLDFLTQGALAACLSPQPRVVTLHPLPPEDWTQPAAAFVLQEVTEALGLPRPADERPALPLDEAALDAGRRTLAARGVAGPFVLVHPGSGSVRKNWPMERFAEVADRVRREMGRTVVWLAGPAEVERGTVPAASETVLADLSLVESAAVCALSEAYLGNDSGVTQMAAAVRPRHPATPVVALFGPTDARVWAPRGDHVRVVRSADGTMAGIGLEEVWEAVEHTLD